MSNLDFWNSVSKTNPAHTKKAKMGQMNITAIDPQQQRKNATEKFGMFGLGFGLEDVRWEQTTIGDTVLLQLDASLWYIHDGERGSFPVTSQVKLAYVTANGSGYLKVDDEAAKKAQTDALTKGLSMLGFNSDVFEGLFDDNKYVQEMVKEFTEAGNPVIIKAKEEYAAMSARFSDVIGEMALQIDQGLASGEDDLITKAYKTWNNFNEAEKKTLRLPSKHGGFLTPERKAVFIELAKGDTEAAAPAKKGGKSEK